MKKSLVCCQHRLHFYNVVRPSVLISIKKMVDLARPPQVQPQGGHWRVGRKGKVEVAKRGSFRILTGTEAGLARARWPVLLRNRRISHGTEAGGMAGLRPLES